MRSYLKQYRGLRDRAAARAEVDISMISKILHGVAKSEPVARAISEEERGYAKVA